MSVELAGHRDALLAVASRVTDDALTLPTRNDGWTVRDVLAHILAADAGLITLLEWAAQHRAGPTPTLDEASDARETARWSDADTTTLARELRARGARWRALLDALPNAGFDVPVSVWWLAGPAPLGTVLQDWRPHDTQHTEDIRLALVQSPTSNHAASNQATGQ